jgi:1-acyl-sn-glycerol-3-phosphate acyltransferase
MFRAAKLILLVAWIGFCFIFAILFVKLKKLHWRDWISRVCYKGIAVIAGIKLTVRGGLSTARPLLVVSNHVSYLDVIVLGGVFPFRFTPKQEIAGWPAIGAICKTTGCVFVDRSAKKIHESTEKIRTALQQGEVISLFPESTTGTGIKTLPFKPAFFHLADAPIAGAELAVQPAAIIYTHIRGLPIDSCQWPTIAWYGDMVLLPHLWHLLKLGRIKATLEFLPPASLKEHGDRKGLAAHCQSAISAAIESARKRL